MPMTATTGMTLPAMTAAPAADTRGDIRPGPVTTPAAMSVTATTIPMSGDDTLRHTRRHTFKPTRQRHRQLLQQRRQLRPLLRRKRRQQGIRLHTAIAPDHIRQPHPLLRQKHLPDPAIRHIQTLLHQPVRRQPLDQLTRRRRTNPQPVRQLPLTDPLMLPQQRQKPPAPAKPAPAMPLTAIPTIQKPRTQTHIPENRHQRIILHPALQTNKEPNKSIPQNPETAQHTRKPAPKTPKTPNRRHPRPNSRIRPSTSATRNRHHVFRKTGDIPQNTPSHTQAPVPHTGHPPYPPHEPRTTRTPDHRTPKTARHRQADRPPNDRKTAHHARIIPKRRNPRQQRPLPPLACHALAARSHNPHPAAYPRFLWTTPCTVPLFRLPATTCTRCPSDRHSSPTSARKHPARPPVRQNKQVSPLEITTANGIPATGNITQPVPISRKTRASHVNITATDTQSGKKRQHRHIAPS